MRILDEYFANLLSFGTDLFEDKPIRRIFAILHADSRSRYGRYSTLMRSPHGSSIMETCVEILSGAVTPARQMKDDLAEMAQPYRNSAFVVKDALQPLRGLGNLILGALILAFTPIIFTNMIFSTITNRLSEGRKVWAAMIVVMPISMTINGIMNIVRGVTQIATTPLVWLIKIPLRAVLTQQLGNQNPEEDADLHQLVEQGINPEGDSESRIHAYDLLRVRMGIAQLEGRPLYGYHVQTGIHSRESAVLLALFRFLPESVKPFLIMSNLRARISIPCSEEYYDDSLVRYFKAAQASGQYNHVAHLLEGLINTSKLFLLMWRRSRRDKIEPLMWLPRDLAQLVAKTYLTHPSENVEAIAPQPPQP